MAAEQMKCAHPGCACMVSPNGPHGKYCSEHCKQAGDRVELHCDAITKPVSRLPQSHSTLMAPKLAANFATSSDGDEQPARHDRENEASRP